MFDDDEMFNPRRAGGVLTPPSGFSQISKKGSTERHRFWHTYLYIASAHIVKISDRGHSTSGHQITPSDLTSEKVRMLVIATANDRSLRNFQILISVAVSMKCVSRNFGVGNLRSGQFYDLSIASQREKNEGRLLWTKTIRNTLKHRTKGSLDTLSQYIATSNPSSCRQGHFRS